MLDFVPFVVSTVISMIKGVTFFLINILCVDFVLINAIYFFKFKNLTL